MNPTLQDGALARPVTEVELPADPAGAALATFVKRVRLAIAHGDVVVDSTEALTWSPGPRLVLHRLQQLAERAGRRWTDTAAST